MPFSKKELFVFIIAILALGGFVFLVPGGDRADTPSDLVAGVGAAAWDLSTASYDKVSFYVGGEETSPNITFKPDGTKMYVNGGGSDRVHQYTLTTPWDISTTRYDDISFRDPGTYVIVSAPPPDNFRDDMRYRIPNGAISFKTNGTKMYILDGYMDAVHQYTLAIPWDISTASYNSVYLNISRQDTIPQGLAFKNDGTAMYVVGDTNNIISQYTLSTPWNLSTASYNNISFSVAGQTIDPEGAAFKNDGTKMYVISRTNSIVYQYTLSTAWNVSTASYDNIAFKDDKHYGTSGADVAFSTNGAKMYILNDYTDSIYQYSLTGQSQQQEIHARVEQAFSNMQKYIETTLAKLTSMNEAIRSHSSNLSKNTGADVSDIHSLLNDMDPHISSATLAFQDMRMAMNRVLTAILENPDGVESAFADVRASARRVLSSVESAKKLLLQALSLLQQKASQIISKPASELEIKVYDTFGKPLPKEQLIPRFAGSVVVGVFPLDKDYNTIPFGVASVENGMVKLAEIQKTPYILHFSPKVPGFGQVKMYADNGGGGYTTLNGKIDLPLEVAKTRIANIEELIKNYPKNIFRQETLDRLSSAKRHLDIAAKSETVNAREVYQALNDGLWSGEMATIDAAEYDITQRGRRNDFSFGIKIGSKEFEENWDAKEDFVSSVFNFITIPEFFIAGYEREKDKPNPESAERILSWADSVGIKTKGHPLIYTIPQNTPSWLEGADFQTFSDAMQNRIERDAGHFKGHIKVWDIINEANNPNQLYSQDELVQLTKTAGAATKIADPNAIRVVNINLPTGDTLADQNAGQFALAGNAQTPYQYFKALQQANADYDVVGIQMYGSWSLDIMEISRMLDRYAKLRKPIHITEIGVSSAPGIDKESQYFQDESEIYALGQWHAPWSEAVQADWAEQFYTIAYSKPAIEAITWWDLTDDFWPFGGLLHRDGTPKQSYTRLKALLESWGYNKK